MKPPVDSFIYDTEYGTPQRKGFQITADNKIVIKNIFNLKSVLEVVIKKFNESRNDKKYDNTWKVAATMNIYEDGRDYEFTVLPDTA
jgi:hypothetical protein